MADYDLVLRGRRVHLPEGAAPREIGVRGGTIATIAPLGTSLTGDTVVDLAVDEALLPGLVDSHVHVNEPGRTEWEGFASATRAAAAGGVTTIVDMPLNSIPPTTTAAALQIKQTVAHSRVAVDVAFWGGAVPGNLNDLEPLHRAGVAGFKCFLIDSGVAEFPPLTCPELDAAMREIARLGSLLIVHAEDPGIIDHAPHEPGTAYASFLASRPPAAENQAIADVIDAMRETGARAHILHLSSASALPLLAKAKDEGLPLTVETCPHYLALSAEAIPNGATAYKCCPPIRSATNRDALWAGLIDGTIDLIASDHSPATRALKQPPSGDFDEAWGGISSLQVSLAVVWTEAHERRIPLDRVLEWMAVRPARLAGLPDKGRIAVGAAADFAVFAPDAEFTVDATTLHHRNPVTPYDGARLRGVVRDTYLAGRAVTRDRALGRLLRRDDEGTGASASGPTERLDIVS